jgi:hypothetical protein
MILFFIISQDIFSLLIPFVLLHIPGPMDRISKKISLSPFVDINMMQMVQAEHIPHLVNPNPNGTASTINPCLNLGLKSRKSKKTKKLSLNFLQTL